MLKQKLIAIIILAISVLCITMGEATFAIIGVPAGFGLLFSKRNWSDINYEED